MMKIADPRPTPNHKIANGIQAMGGMGRRIPIIKPDKSSAILNQPMSIPSGMATRAATINPKNTRMRVLTVSVKRVPLVMRFSKACKTA